jgi:hypothetical protein
MKPDPFVNFGSKEQSNQWMQHTHSSKAIMFKQMFYCQKADGTCFLGQDRRVVLMVEFMQHGTTLAPQVSCETMKNCVRSFRRKVVQC